MTPYGVIGQRRVNYMYMFRRWNSWEIDNSLSFPSIGKFKGFACPVTENILEHTNWTASNWFVCPDTEHQPPDLAALLKRWSVYWRYMWHNFVQPGPLIVFDCISYSHRGWVKVESSGLSWVPSCVADSPVGGAATETGKDNGQHEKGVMDREMLTL